ncbi:Octopamine receptor [Holothuria leucospilota]|uniref:Octopamine receptor n=1 Tax=Holothuria leucospilota TaxID=206669 RepID=A0A9Q1HAV6_HOLLE|nr:Octopamine receptor [Holothuria leucospilota]
MEAESPLWESILVTVLYGFLAVVTIGGNFLVVVTFFEDQHIRKKLSNFFIVNLAFADLFCGFFIFAVKFGKEFWGLFQPPEAGPWPFGESECIIWITGGTCLIYSSLFSVVAISYDRFLLVKDALKYTATTTRKRVLKMIFAIWIVAITYSISTCMLKYFVFRENENETPSAVPTGLSTTLMNETFIVYPTTPGFLSFSVCTEDVYSFVSYYTVFIAFDFLMFFCVLAFTNSCVSLKLLERARKGVSRPTDRMTNSQKTKDKIIMIENSDSRKSNTTESESKEETDKTDISETTVGSANKREEKREMNVTKDIPNVVSNKRKVDPKQHIQLKKSRKAVISLAILVAAFVICWCPYYVIAMLNHSGLVEVSETVIDLSLDLIWFNSSINPFLYAMTNVRFKRGMVSVLRRHCLCPWI